MGKNGFVDCDSLSTKSCTGQLASSEGSVFVYKGFQASTEQGFCLPSSNDPSLTLDLVVVGI